VLERPLLDSYCDTLITQGVTGYSREALHRNYRVSVLWQNHQPGLAMEGQHPAGDLVE
jgi:hypothetical protein